MPGDIAVFRYPNGMVEHTGVVVHVDTQVLPRMPWLVSKWGDLGEFIHAASNSPYRSAVTYMREGYDDH
jgi:hypothetical protein